MGWTGDLGQMGQLQARLAELATVPARTARVVAEQLDAELQAEFDGGHDPYGDAWAPLAPATLDKGRFPPPLTDTAAMRESLVVQPMRAAGVEILIDHPAAPHQTGWSGRQGDGPARPILPARGELPDAYVEIIEAAAEAAFRGRRA